MREGLVVTWKFRAKRTMRATQSADCPVSSDTPAGKIPRISRLMALAIHFDELIQSGAVRDQAELARLGGVSRARITQVMNLLNLAPAIQEDILHLSCVEKLQHPITERSLRGLLFDACWEEQTYKWKV